MRIFLFILLIGSVAVKAQTINDNECFEHFEVQKIPKAIKHEIKVTYKHRFVMVNPDKNFQETDVKGGRKLKERRLVFWSNCDGVFILVYEHGGFGYHKHVITFKKEDGSYVIKKNISVGDAKTLNEVRKALNENDRLRLDDF